MSCFSRIAIDSGYFIFFVGEGYADRDAIGEIAAGWEDAFDRIAIEELAGGGHFGTWAAAWA